MTDAKRTLQIVAKLIDSGATAGFRALMTGGKLAGTAIEGTFKLASLAIAGLTTVSVAAFAVFRKVGEDLEKVANAADNLSVTAESLTAIRGAADNAGVSFEDLTTSIRAFERVLADARDGGRKQREALRAIGLSAEELSTQQLDVVDVLARVADGLQGVDSAADRTRILMDLFGKSGTNLGTLLKPGGDAIRRLTEEAERLGLVFSIEELNQVRAFNEAFGQLQKVLRGLVERVVVELSPALTKLFETLKKEITDNSSQIRAGMADLLLVLVDGFGLLQNLIGVLQKSAIGWELIAATASRTKAVLFGTNEEVLAASERILEITERMHAMVKAGDESGQTLERLRASLQKLRAEPPPPISEGEKIKVDAPKITGLELFRDGVEEAIERWSDLKNAAKSAGAEIVDVSLNSFSNELGNAIANTKSWEDAWDSFRETALNALGQVIAKLITVRAVGLIFGGGNASIVAGGFAKGGVVEGSVIDTLPIRAFAGGGIVNEPTLAIVGEGRAPGEAFVPLPDGRSIPVTFSGAAPSGRRDVHLHFHSPEGDRAYDMLKRNRAAVQEIVSDDLDRDTPFRHRVAKVAR